MLKIQYQEGQIEITTETGTYLLTKIEQIYLVSDLLRYYRMRSKTEQTFRYFTMILDLLRNSQNELIRYHELKYVQETCCPSPYPGQTR